MNEQSIEKIALFYLSDSELLLMDNLLFSVHQASAEIAPGPFQTQLLHSLINALLYQTANMYLTRQSSAASITSRPAQILQQYKDLIKIKFREIKRPAAYAALLNISVSHLNDTVKALTGYSATYLLQQEVIGEAQRQLRYTTRTGREIAFDLGYSDHKYFIRLFSKVTGHLPSMFRKDTRAQNRGQF